MMYDMKKAEERILEYCAERALGDAAAPEDIACALMNEPGVLRMHGPEHHFLTAASLCAAWCAERRDDARPRLERLRVRCAQIPAGVCGYYGVCGDTLAAISSAVSALSELTGAALPRPERIKCTFRAMNSQCIGKDCIFCDGIPG